MFCFLVSDSHHIIVSVVFLVKLYHLCLWFLHCFDTAG